MCTERSVYTIFIIENFCEKENSNATFSEKDTIIPILWIHESNEKVETLIWFKKDPLNIYLDKF